MFTCLHTASYKSSCVMPCAMRCPKTSLKVFVATPSILLVLTLRHIIACEFPFLCDSTPAPVTTLRNGDDVLSYLW